MATPEQLRSGLRRAIMADNQAAASELSDAYRRALMNQGFNPAEAGTLVTREYTDAREAKDTGVLGNFFKGVGSGAVGLGETAALGLAALQEEEAELESREKIKNFFGGYKPEGGDPDSMSYKLGSGIGSIAALLPTAALAATPLGSAGALTAAGTVSVAAGAGEASERAREEGATEEDRNTAAILGSLVGATEILPLGRMFEAFELDALNDLIRVADPEVVTNAASRIKNAGKTGTVEGLQEFGAAVAQNAIERGYNPDQAIVNYEAAEEGGIGAAAGAIFQGVIDTVVPGRRGIPGDTQQDTETSSEETTPAAQASEQQQRTEITPEIEAAADELAGEQEQLSLFDQDTLETATEREERNLGQEDLIAGARTDQLADTSPEEIDAAITELTADGDVDPATLTEEDITTMVELQKEGRTPERSGYTQTPEQLDLLEEARRADERGENDLRNEALVAGEQQDMFARERGQDTAGLMRRRGEAARAQEAEDKARADQEELDALFEQEDREYQRELDFRGPQSVRGQQELFPEDPGIETIQRREGTERPEPLTNEVSPQQELDFDRQPGINPRRNRQRQVRKELERGQAQRQRRKDRQAQARQRLQELVAQRRTARPAPSPQVQQPRSPEQVGEAPLTQAVRMGINEQTQQVQAPQAPQVPSTEARDSTPVRPAKTVKEARPASKTKTATVARQKTDTKPKTQKPVKAKTTKAPGTKASPKQTAPAAKKDSPKQEQRRAERSVKAVRAGKKNEQVVSERTDQKVADAANNIRKSQNTAVNKYLNASEGDVDVLVDSIAFDITAKEPERQPRRGKAKKGEEGKRLYELEMNEQANPTDKRWSGTGEKVAKEALKGMKADPALAPLAARVEKRMKSSDITRRAELNRKNIGMTADVAMADINNLQVELEATEARLNQAEIQADELKGTKYRDFYNMEVRPLENRVKEIRAKIKAKKRDVKNLPIDALLETTKPVPFNVRSSLTGNRLAEALTRLRTTVNNARLKNLMQKLAKNAGVTQVVVMRNLTAPDGTAVAGFFSPSQNTIYLDSVDGMNVHTVLHETLHAVTSETLANKSNATTKQLQRLYDAVKDKLGTAYGTQDLDEFVAEAFSNPDFQKELARIRTDGSPVPAWRQFINTIMNAVRRLFNLETKSPNSAMSELDSLVMSIIHPAPTTRPAGDLFMAATPDLAGSKLGETEERLTRKTANAAEQRAWTNNAVDFVKEASEPVKKIFNKALQMQGLADVAQYYGLGDIGHRMLKAFNKQRGRQEVMDQNIKDKLVRIGKLYDKLSDAQRKLLNQFIYDPDFGATIMQVDVLNKSKSHYTDVDRQEAYEQSKEWWDAMDPAAKWVYKEMRTFYEDQRFELGETLRKRIAETIEKSGSSQSAGLIDKLADKLINESQLDVYFPLMREGDYVVAYEIKDENGFPVGAVRQFESESEANLFVEALKGDSGYVKGSVKRRKRSNQAPTIDDVPPTSFMYDILKQMKENGVPKEAIDDVIDVYINTLPEASILKGYKRRKNTIGFVTDANYALNRKGYQTGAQIVRLESVRELGQLKTELNNTVSDEEMPEKTSYQVQLAEELNNRVDFVLNGAKNKGFENVVKNLNQGAFVYTIGFNVASAIVNLSQVPMVAFPMLGGKYGYNQTRKAILEASSIVTGARGVATEESRTGKAFAKASLAHGIDKYFEIGRDREGNISIQLRDDLDLPAKRIEQLRGIQQMVLAAKEQGQLTSSFLNEALGLEEGGKKVESGWFNKLTGLSAGMFSQAERYNRQVTLIATYNLQRDKLKAEGMSDVMARKEAAEYAIEYTQRINGGSTLETASGLSQEGIGRVALMYKNYGIQMYTMMFQTGKQAINEMFKGNPKQKKEALRQIIGLHGSALFFSGVYGMPLYGAISAIYNALADDDEEDFDTVVQSYMNQGMFRGGVNALLEGLGVDVDAGIRMRMTDLLLQEDRFNPNPSPEERIGGLVGGVALSIGKRFIRGAEDVSNGEYQRGIEQLVPAAITNMMKPFRYAEQGGIRTRRYDLIHGDLSSGEVAAQVIGFAPEEYLRQQEQNRRVKNIDEAINSKASKLTKKYYVALRTGDISTALQVRREINEFNKRNPKFALTPERVERSLKGHLRTTEKMYNGVSISKRMQEYLNQQNEDVLDTVLFPKR